MLQYLTPLLIVAETWNRYSVMIFGIFFGGHISCRSTLSFWGNKKKRVSPSWKSWHYYHCDHNPLSLDKRSFWSITNTVCFFFFQYIVQSSTFWTDVNCTKFYTKKGRTVQIKFESISSKFQRLQIIVFQDMTYGCLSFAASFPRISCSSHCGEGNFWLSVHGRSQWDCVSFFSLVRSD